MEEIVPTDVLIGGATPACEKAATDVAVYADGENVSVADARNRYESCISDVAGCVRAVLHDFCPRLQDGIVMAVARMREGGRDVDSVEVATKLVRSDMAIIPDGALSREITAATSREPPELDHVMKATVRAWTDCVAVEHGRRVTEVPNAPTFVTFFRGVACAFVTHVLMTEDGDFKGALSFKNASTTDAAVERIVRDSVSAVAPMGFVLQYASVPASEEDTGPGGVDEDVPSGGGDAVADEDAPAEHPVEEQSPPEPEKDVGDDGEEEKPAPTPDNEEEKEEKKEEVDDEKHEKEDEEKEGEEKKDEEKEDEDGKKEDEVKKEEEDGEKKKEKKSEDDAWDDEGDEKKRRAEDVGDSTPPKRDRTPEGDEEEKDVTAAATTPPDRSPVMSGCGGGRGYRRRFEWTHGGDDDDDDYDGYVVHGAGETPSLDAL